MKISKKKKEAIVSTLTPLLSRNDGTAHLASTVIQNTISEDGGPGSGNWGHEGVEGQVGGSAPGGGKHNRITNKHGKFTSFAKRRKKLASPHNVTHTELLDCPAGSKLIGYGSFDGEVWEKHDSLHYVSAMTGEIVSAIKIGDELRKSGKQCQLIIPKSASTSYSKGKPHNLSAEEVKSKKTGSTVVIGGETYVKKSDGFWDNPADINDYYSSSELIGKKGVFYEPGEKVPGSGKSNNVDQKFLWSLPKGSTISGLTGDDEWEKFEGAYFINKNTSEVMSAYNISQKVAKEGLNLTIKNPEKPAAEKQAPQKQTSSKQGKKETFVDTPSGMGCSNGDECFTPERKKNGAMFEDAKSYDDVMRKQTGDIWQNLEQSSRKSLYKYTEGYNENMNAALREERDDMGDHYDDIVNITNAIEASPFPRDMTIPRGVGKRSVSIMLGCDPDDLLDEEFLKSLPGRTMTDPAFMSCGSSKGKGIGKKCRLNIFCPKGTKGIYAEPFSAFGNGKGINWDEKAFDGKSEQSSFSHEFETILQRGTTLRITGARIDSDRIVIDCEVVKQNPALI